MDTIYMDQASFDELPDYSCSIPTGTTIGKQWKRRKRYHADCNEWLMGEYVPHDDPSLVGIVWRKIEVIEIEVIE